MKISRRCLNAQMCILKKNVRIVLRNSIAAVVAVRAYNFNGDINKPYELACEFEKKRLECSIAIEAHKKLS